MCGIAGIRRHHVPALADDVCAVEQYVQRLFHRGPDNQSVEKVDGQTVLGSARLRITDAKNKSADMPFWSRDKRHVIVFNGEIYNHQSLRNKMPAYDYQTHSDTETLLLAYRTWGTDCLDHLEGMFSFCILDCKDETLFLAVDPMGQKPLYYCADDESFRFASELSPLLEDPRYAYSWNIEALSELVSQRMIVGGDTHIKEIKKLDAGCSLFLNKHGKLLLQRYFYLNVQEGLVSDEDAAQMIQESFLESVASMAPLEVPGAVFLSGGLDSSSVLAGLSKIGSILPTYTIGFEAIHDTPTFSDAIVDNEFSFTKRLAENSKTENIRKLLSAPTYFQYWDSWTSLMDEPLCFNETAAHLALFEEASGANRVVYGGAGADELFDGYGFGAGLLAQDASMESICSEYYHRFNYSFGCDMSSLLCDRTTAERTIKKLNSYLTPYLSRTNSALQGAQCVMAHARLPHAEFKQVDRVSMHHSIEVRLPFANRAFLDAAFSFSPALKSKDGVSKYVLRKAVESLLPEYITTRPKVPFAPIGELFFTEYCNKRLKELFDDSAVLPSLGVIDMDYVQSLYQSSDPGSRPALVNLLLINRVLCRQAPFLSKEIGPWTGLNRLEKKQLDVSKDPSF